MQDYDKELFEKIYYQTTSLRRMLAYQIDARRFGVTPDIILSWFDDKFLLVFNKYFGKKDPEVLKGYIINSLKTFKYRILRKAYQPESMQFYSNLIELEDSSEVYNIIDRVEESSENIFLGLAVEFIKERLSNEAYLIFQIQIDPPFYVTSRMKNPNGRIPTNLILEFLGIEPTKYAISRINKIRRQVNEVIDEAKSYFNTQPLTV